MANNMGIIVVAGIVLAVLAGYITVPGLQLGAVSAPEAQQEAQSSGGIGYASTLTAGGINSITGASVDVNSEIYANDGTFSVAETQTDSQPESLSTAAPNSMAGYLIIGNDADQSGTDRGTEVYYRKVPFEYQNKGTYQIKDTDGGQWIKLTDEGVPTLSGYDDGTAESTLNVSVGSGQTVTSTEIKIAAPTDAAIGNPDFPNPVGICFNVSDESKWDEIRPSSYVDTFDSCEVHSGRSMLDTCYVLPTDAIQDYEEYRFYIVLDAATGQDPATGATPDYAYAYLMDKTWYKNDQGVWESGWCDDSSQGTDYDPGIAATTATNDLAIWFS